MADKDIENPEADTIKDDETTQDVVEETSEDEAVFDEQEEPEEEEERNLSSGILRVLAILAVGAVGGIWAAPKIAPMLPAGLKPVAEFLSPQADTSAQITALQTDFEARLAKVEAAGDQQEVITQITPVLDQLKSKDADLGANIDALSQSTKVLKDSLAALQADLTKITARQALTSQNGQVSDEALQQFEDKLAAITDAQQKLNQSQSQAVEAQQDASSKLRMAEATSALAQITNALKAGKPFQAALTRLSNATDITAPAGLTDIAGKGTPPLPALKKQFPDLARTALHNDAAASAGDTTLGLFTSFLKSQVGTRSLEPQSGDNLDAVLSRIEAALDAGDTAATLTETAALSAPAQETMAEWIAALTRLNTATSAVQAVQQQLTTN
ncbi:MAG: hypothetical protein JKX71_06490 [Amylibacter sp.]|nr:hypothetical protein [Amylibacter sp.]